MKDLHQKQKIHPRTKEPKILSSKSYGSWCGISPRGRASRKLSNTMVLPARPAKLHFIGIGGIGVSALAQYYLAMGCEVSGSDLAQSEITDLLKKEGIKVYIKRHSARNIPKDTSMVICTLAATKDNPELIAAKKRKIKIQTYPEALGELTKKYFTIAVSGTHGKSTTSAMIALILIKAGLDPTVIIGTKLKEFGNTNFRMGNSEFLVIEADEYQEAFLNYWPSIIILTNIEEEHLDYYKNLKNIIKSYKTYIKHISDSGLLIVNRDDKITMDSIRYSKNKIKTTYFSLKQKEAPKLKKILKLPGEHNIANALAALTLGRALRVSDKLIFKALSGYSGSWRRFELTHAELRGTTRLPAGRQGTTRKFIIVSDYAHHPTEIRVTLKAAREKYPKRRIWCVYQPHQYQRTHRLFNQFLTIFAQAPVNKLILTKIYDVAGRETSEISKRVTSEDIVRRVKSRSDKDIIYIEDMWEIPAFLRKNIRDNDIVIIMGAGDIYKIKSKIQNPKPKT